ncbi:hypothetical protein JOF28_001965 [Leucobacter exalbidus]|uniref:Uncharacterized protein n=1 Tax=Leucobacter exalbidus TaxID=662960 RepID=A0A940T4B5_9MICO|nr:hypothetical protein [Leucobacter exalbidus]MBP1326733.1 hypothetical protein [Leucobacter exalbidus]
MPVIDIAPLYMDGADLSIEGDDYAAHISGASFVPTSSTVTWTGAKPNATFTRQSRATWVLTLNYAQDWESAKSLSQYLHDHEGKVVDIILAPVTGGKAFTASVTIAPGTIGAEINTFGTSTVSLGLNGRPEYTVIAP